MPDTPTPAPAPRIKGYPGRPELDAANMRFRRALTRCAREAGRHDQTLFPKLETIVRQATADLLRLAEQAEKVEEGSARHRKGLKDAEDKLNRSIRRAVRQGAPLARLLDQSGPRGDDTA